MIYYYDWSALSNKLSKTISNNSETNYLLEFYNENIRNIESKSFADFLSAQLAYRFGSYAYIPFRDMYNTTCKKVTISLTDTKKRWMKDTKCCSEHFKYIEHTNEFIDALKKVNSSLTLTDVYHPIINDLQYNSKSQYFTEAQNKLDTWGNDNKSNLCDFPFFSYLSSESKVHFFSVDLLITVLPLLDIKDTSSLTPQISSYLSMVDYYSIDLFTLLTVINNMITLSYKDCLTLQYIFNIASDTLNKDDNIVSRIKINIEQLSSELYGNYSEQNFLDVLALLKRLENLNIKYEYLNEALNYKNMLTCKTIGKFQLFNIYSYYHKGNEIELSINYVLLMSLQRKRSLIIIKQEQSLLQDITAKAMYEQLFFLKEHTINNGQTKTTVYRIDNLFVYPFKDINRPSKDRINTAFTELVTKKVILKSFKSIHSSYELVFLDY